MSDLNKTMEAYKSMVSEKKHTKEEREECPKCEGNGCDHCDNKGYHEVSEARLGATKTFKTMEDWVMAVVEAGGSVTKRGNNLVGSGLSRTQSATFELKKGRGSMIESVELDEAIDPVDDKANDKKFKDRKDKDIDNDGDVDSSDEFLHKRRAAIDNEKDGGEKPAETDKEPKKKKKGSNPKTDDKTAEISKIGETFEIMWAEIEEALNQKKGATEPEKMDDKESPKGKEFKAKHSVDVKSHDDMEKIEEPKKREVKKEMTEYEVIAKILSGKIED